MKKNSDLEKNNFPISDIPNIMRSENSCTFLFILRSFYSVKVCKSINFFDESDTCAGTSSYGD